MAATDQSNGNALADSNDGESLVRLAVKPSAANIAATGVLAHQYASRGQPYHATLVRPGQPTPTGPEVNSIQVLAEETETDRIDPQAVSESVDQKSAAVPDWLDHALAAILDPTELEKDPEVSAETGLGIPWLPADTGLAASSLVHGVYSGAPKAAESLLDSSSDPGVQAGVVTLETIESAPVTSRVGDALSRFVNPIPTPNAPTATLQGAVDLFDVLASVDPGRALGIACGGPTPADLADQFRQATESLHTVVQNAERDAQGSIAIFTVDIPHVGPLSRLCHIWRSDREITLVTDGTTVGIASTTHETADLVTAANAVGATNLVWQAPRRLTMRLPAERLDDLQSSLGGMLE